MEKNTENAMIENLQKNTGKSLEAWIEVFKQKNFSKHSEGVKFLKENYNLGLFYADLIVHKANGTDSASIDTDTLIEASYKGKEHLKPIYNILTEGILKLGDDIDVSPKKGYVSIRRKKQFACLKPATKTRFELDLIIKGQEEVGVLQAIKGAGAMCTHRINLESENDIIQEVWNWVKKAYEKAS